MAGSGQDERPDQREPRSSQELTAKVSDYKLGLWLRCQALWAYQYVHGMWSKPTPSQAYGTAWDRTMRGGYAEKLSSGKDPSPEDARGRFAYLFDEQAQEVEDWKNEDGETRGQLLDVGTSHAEHWAKETMPTVRPLIVGRQFAIGNNDWTIRGEVDMTAEIEGAEGPLAGPMIVDFKTAAKSWSVADAKQQSQAVTYTAVARSGALGDVATDRMLFEVAVRLKRGPKRQRFVVPVTERDHQHFLRFVESSRRSWAAAIQAGIFLPNRKHFMCSRRHCPRWRECEREHGGTVRD